MSGIASGIRLDPEVDDVLAGHPGHGRAADVLEPRPGPRGLDQPGDVARDVLRPRVPGMERRGQQLVGADRQIGHRLPSVGGDVARSPVIA